MKCQGMAVGLLLDTTFFKKAHMFNLCQQLFEADMC